MATNPFASLLSGLTSSLPSSAKGTYLGTLTSPNAVKARAGTPYIPSVGGSIGMSIAPKLSTPTSSGIGSQANKTAAGGTVPYLPSSGGSIGMSILPTATSATTKLPTSGYAGAQTPANASAYALSNPATPKSTYLQTQASNSSPAATGNSFGNFAATAPAPLATASVGAGVDIGTGTGTSGTTGTTGAGFGSSSTGPPGSSPSYRQQYLDMLSGYYSNDDLKAANKEVDYYNKRQSETELEQRRQEDYIRKNKAGALARGVSGQVAENNRVSSKELADLAIARSPYDSYVNNALSAAKTAAGFEQDDAKTNEPFTLSEGQSRYTYNPATGQYSQVGTQATPTTSSDDPVIQSWAKYISENPAQIGSVPAEIRNNVIAALQNQPVSQKPEVQAAMQKAGVMLGQGGNGGAIDQAIQQIGPLTTGFIGKQSADIAGTPAYNLSKAIDVIKANLGFQELAAMRAASPTGGALGSITERELDLLQSTVASLDQGQNSQILKDNLNKVKKHYRQWLDLVQQSNGGAAPQGGGESGGLYHF